MKSLKNVLATAGVALGAGALLLTVALPASASTQGRRDHVNYEWIDGFLAGQGALANAPVVPLKLTGAVNTRGSINLGGNSSVSGIPTRKGTLTVQHGNPSPAPQLNYRSCRETETISTTYKVLGHQSSGVFWGAHGSGHAVVVFSAIAPRYHSGTHKGQCNFSQNAQPEPYGAWVSFRAQGPLYLRHH
ncbi:MAG TPA: hypothetical protein VH021_01160 [Trebonia sp.]|jgi:hypothetical protein|nr:hypothetical protein [Trebonia sp.]